MTEKQEEHWIKAYWRPAMGWLYMAICFVDFILFPLLAMFVGRRVWEERLAFVEKK